MSKLTPPISTVRHGGFALSDMILRGRKADVVKRVSDTEVYAIYTDLEDSKIKFRQTFKAEKDGDDARKNITETIEKSVDEGKTWTKIYDG